MNNKKFALFTLLPFLFLAVSCTIPTNVEPVETKQIAVSKNTVKTVYNIGDAFSLDGLLVFDSVSGEDIFDYSSSIEEGYIFKLDDVGDRVVIISKEGYKSANYQIKIEDLTPLVISQYPQTEFTVGDYFNYNGMIVTANEEVISDFNCNLQVGSRLIEVGQKIVEISKIGYRSANYTINISDLPLLEIAQEPYATTYRVGEPINLDGLIVKYSDEVINDYTLNYVDGYIFHTPGTYLLLISKDGFKTTSVTLNILPKEQLVIKTLPSKTEFDVGDYFTSSGLVITDSMGNVISDYQTSIAEGERLKVAGKRTITVSKSGYSDVTYEITVNDTGSVVTNRTLNIYYLNDTHGAFIRQSLSSSTNEAGMAYIASYIKDRIKTDKNNGNASIVLSGGDMFQGGLESNETRGAIMIDAMNIIGFDAMVLGNHEFDWGDEYIDDFADQLDCPILSANTFYADSGELLDCVEPYTIVEQNDMKIGIIGGACENMGSSIEGNISNKFYFPNPTSYVLNYAKELRLNHNCDVVIAAFHDEGYSSGSGENAPTKFSALTDIDEETGRAYVDALFFAHDHLTKSGKYNNIPYLEAGCNGRYVGNVRLSMSGNGYGYDKVNSSTTQNIYAYDNCRDENQNVSDLVNKYADEIGDPNEVICRFYKSYSREDFTVLACQAMIWYVNEHLDLFDNRKVYFASHNTGGIRSYPVPSGNFTRRDLFKVFPFDDCLYIQNSTSSQINAMRNNDKYRTSELDNIVYNIYNQTQAVTISYIAESNYARYYQINATKYSPTAKDALVAYLKNGDF